MSNTLKYGGATALALSLLLLSRGLAASAPPPGDIAVDPAKAQNEPPAVVEPPAPPPPQPAPVQSADPAADAARTSGLRQLVAEETAHPEPLRPEVACMARTIYREAANQTLSGRLAVAQVILNRVKSGAFAHSVCDVVEQPAQFAEAPMTEPRSKPWSEAVAIAVIAEENRFRQVAPGALYFHAASMTPDWSAERERVAQIGDHVFYR